MSTKKIALPVPPHIVAKVISLAANPDCSVPEISKILRADPVLTAQILKAVNSPFYGLRQKISAVDRAVAFMGIRAVRNLVLCLGVQGLAPPKSPYPLELFWEFSLRRAGAAKCLSKRLGLPEPDEMFTLGLCQDLGLLALIGENSEAAQKLASFARLPAPERLAAEREMSLGHDVLSTQMFEEWSFPEGIVEPVRFHHDPEAAPEPYQARARICAAAEAIADMLEVDDKRLTLDVANAKLEELGLNVQDMGTILDDVSEIVTQAAEMLQVKVGRQPSYQEIAEAASQGLLALNLSYQSLTEELQKSLGEQQKLAQRLEQLNKDLERRAMTDELTGLPNRRAFDEAVRRELERAKRIEKPLCLLMLDLDKFKIVNDTHGHQAGDAVLVEVAAVLRDTCRACDFAARLGGEEFVVILPHTPKDGAVVAAERIRQRVEEVQIRYDKKILRITVSIGVAEVKDPGRPRAEVAAMRSADDALYEAKEKGRNCIVAAD
ncbi:MAG: GGDEF domain-containing protein [Myxococcota bacterium]|jgi:diguanylate cyclase (GGDEF)-like protein|nr:GGDEF domain-containing protein [Myxococcota bacterium]